jgi:CheY-like chemotaxis protein
VESEVERGSIFQFTIPLTAAAPQEEPMVIDANWSGKRALIVDDNATNRQIFAAQLSKWGFETVSAATPTEAVSLLRGRRFELALFDFEMPEMNGVELARHVHGLGLVAETRLILSSSSGTSQQEMLGGGENPFDAFLTKPTKSAVLKEAIRRLLGGASPASRPRNSSSIDSTLAEQRPLRILVAEDNAVNQMVAVRLLQRMGYRPDLASDGVEALKAVHRQQYDVVLMDVQMPEMDGLEAARRITAECDVQERPRLIALTANALKEDRQMCLDATMDDYLSKPLDVGQLQAALLRCEPVKGSERVRLSA